jgi:translation initiation factor 5
MYIEDQSIPIFKHFKRLKDNIIYHLCHIYHIIQNRTTELLKMTEPIRGIEPINDPTYRYQMTPMDVKKERTKVSISNLDQIARDLKLPSKDVLVTYIGKKLSAKTKVDKVRSKSGAHDRVILAGNMDPRTIADTIYPFIDAFVLCPTCRLPELDYSVKKSALRAKCSACGFRGNLEGDKSGQSTLKKFVQILSDTGGGKKKKKNNKRAARVTREKKDIVSVGSIGDIGDNGDSNDKTASTVSASTVNHLDQLLEEEAREQSMINNFS